MSGANRDFVLELELGPVRTNFGMERELELGKNTWELKLELDRKTWELWN